MTGSRKNVRVLVVRLTSLGDVLDATPVAEALKRHWQGAQVGWVVEKRCAEVLEGNPFIDRLHVWDRTLPGLVRLSKEMRAQRYELALDCHGIFKSGLMAWLSGAPVRVGFSNAKENSTMFLTVKFPPRPAYQRVSERALYLLEALGIQASPQQYRLMLPTMPEHEQRADDVLMEEGLEPKRFIALAPATTTPQRHWVEERWAELAERISGRLGLKSALLGGAGDKSLLQRIASAAKAELPVLAGRLSVKESTCVVKRAAALVGLDSFLLHVGLAVGTPVVALFGPTPTTRFRGEAGLTLLEHEYPCRPCGRNPICGGAFTCMKLISTDEVLSALAIWLRVKRGNETHAC